MLFRHVGLSFTLTVALGAALAATSLFGCGSDNGTGESSSDLAQQGAALVTQYKCPTCHGAADGSLSGQGTPQPGTMAYPANITPDSETGIGDWTTDIVVRAILTGLDDEGETLCSTMPRFGTMGVTTAQAEAIATYLKAQPAVSHMVPESSCAQKGGD